MKENNMGSKLCDEWKWGNLSGRELEGELWSTEYSVVADGTPHLLWEVTSMSDE